MHTGSNYSASIDVVFVILWLVGWVRLMWVMSWVGLGLNIGLGWVKENRPTANSARNSFEITVQFSSVQFVRLVQGLRDGIRGNVVTAWRRALRRCYVYAWKHKNFVQCYTPQLKACGGLFIGHAFIYCSCGGYWMHVIARNSLFSVFPDRRCQLDGQEYTASHNPAAAAAGDARLHRSWSPTAQRPDPNPVDYSISRVMQ